MKVKEFCEILERDFPKEAAVSWDHVGLQVGDPEAEIKSVLLTLDADDGAVEEAIDKGVDMILSHHPLIFVPLTSLTEAHFLERKIRKIIKADINAYAMHTNFDILKMGDLNAADLGILDPAVLQVLPEGETSVEGGGFGKIGMLAKETTLAQFADCVKEAAQLPAVRVYGDPDAIVRKVAVSSGAGRSSIPDAVDKGADVLVSGDLDYHNATDANAMGLALVDAGHYGSEFVFMRFMETYLAENVPSLSVYTREVRQPYQVI